MKIDINTLTTDNILLVDDIAEALSELKSQLTRITESIKIVQNSDHPDDQIISAYKVASSHVVSLIQTITNHLKNNEAIQHESPSEVEVSIAARRVLPKNTKSVQFDMFRAFAENSLVDKNDMSNAVDLWDSIPKYFLSTAQIKKLLGDDGKADPYTYIYARNITAQGKKTTSNCRVEITPARIIVGYHDAAETMPIYETFFPGQTEELIEEVLKKLLLEQKLGLHDVSGESTWVKFTLRMIERELAAHGKARSRTEILRSLQIMAKTRIEWDLEGKNEYGANILGDVIRVSQDGLKSDSKDSSAMWAVRLPSMISKSINSLSGYRQFNYERLMLIKDSLARWIYKRCVHRFTYANTNETYSLSFQDVKITSGMLQLSNDKYNRRKLVEALKELELKGVLESYEPKETMEDSKIVDVIYYLKPTKEFISEQVLANKRGTSIAQERANIVY